MRLAAAGSAALVVVSAGILVGERVLAGDPSALAGTLAQSIQSAPQDRSEAGPQGPLGDAVPLGPADTRPERPTSRPALLLAPRVTLRAAPRPASTRAGSPATLPLRPVLVPYPVQLPPQPTPLPSAGLLVDHVQRPGGQPHRAHGTHASPAVGTGARAGCGRRPAGPAPVGRRRLPGAPGPAAAGLRAPYRPGLLPRLLPGPARHRQLPRLARRRVDRGRAAHHRDPLLRRRTRGRCPTSCCATGPRACSPGSRTSTTPPTPRRSTAAELPRPGHHPRERLANRLTASGLPVFFTGDMNERGSYFCRLTADYLHARGEGRHRRGGPAT